MQQQFVWDYDDDSALSGFNVYVVLAGEEYGAEPAAQCGPSARAVTLDLQQGPSVLMWCAVVRALDATGESGDSNEVSLEVPALRPVAPFNFRLG